MYIYTYIYIYTYVYICIHTHLYNMYDYIYTCSTRHLCFFLGWLRVLGSLKLRVSCAKEPYKRDDILQKRPVILRSLLIVSTP